MQTFSGEDHEGVHHRTEHLGGRLPCMLTGRDYRTARLHLEGALVRMEEVARTISRDDMDTLKPAAERYGLATAIEADADADLIDSAEYFHEQAKRVLLVDKAHISIVLLFVDDEIEIIGAEPADQQAKYLLMESAADRVEVLGATGLVHITEAWGAPMLPEGHQDAHLRAGERPIRGASDHGCDH
jgi:hypothetical protein